MKIDRSRFLLLTGVLAATACTVKNAANDAGTGVVAPVADAGDQGDATTTAETGTGACDDSKGDLGICTSFTAGTDAGSNGCIDELGCSTLKSAFKPKIAAKILACVLGLPTAEGSCNGSIACGETALAGACADTTTATSCAQVQTACGDAGSDAGAFSLSDCNKYLAGLTAAGRTDFVGCMTEGGCTDVKNCLPGL